MKIPYDLILYYSPNIGIQLGQSILFGHQWPQNKNTCKKVLYFLCLNIKACENKEWEYESFAQRLGDGGVWQQSTQISQTDSFYMQSVIWLVASCFCNQGNSSYLLLVSCLMLWVRSNMRFAGASCHQETLFRAKHICGPVQDSLSLKCHESCICSGNIDRNRMLEILGTV